MPPAMASSSTTGLLVGVTIGALILLAAVLAWAFPFWRNWILGRSAQHAGKKYHIRVISQAENTSTPLISIPGHSRGDVSRATTLSYAHDNHAQSMPLMMQPDITQHDEYHPEFTSLPGRQLSVSEVSHTSESAYTASSFHSSHTALPAEKPPPSHPLPPVPRQTGPPKSAKRKAPSKEGDQSIRPVERGNTYAIARILQERVQRGGHATPLRQPTDLSIIERPGSIALEPVLPKIDPPPPSPVAAVHPSSAAGPSRPVRPLPQPRNKSMRLPRAPMEPLLEVDNLKSGTSAVFPSLAVKTRKPVIRLDLPVPSSSEEEENKGRPTNAFRRPPAPSRISIASPSSSISAYPFIPLTSAPITSSHVSAFPSTARYSMFPMSAVAADIEYPFSATGASNYDTARDSTSVSAAYPSSRGLPSPIETPTRWAESIIDAYGPESKRYTLEQQYATTAPLRVGDSRLRAGKRMSAMGDRARRSWAMSGDVGKGDVAEAEGVRKKPRLELKLQLDESWGRSSTASNGTVATMDTNGGSTQGLLPERESKPRLREVLVQSARQGLRARGPAVQSFIATPYT